MITKTQADRLEGATRLKTIVDELTQAWRLSCFDGDSAAALQTIKSQVEGMFEELIPNESPANRSRR